MKPSRWEKQTERDERQKWVQVIFKTQAPLIQVGGSGLSGTGLCEPTDPLAPQAACSWGELHTTEEASLPGPGPRSFCTSKGNSFGEKIFEPV